MRNKDFHIDFIGKRKLFFSVSIIILSVALIYGLVFTFITGEFVPLDIQFRGGTIITYTYKGDIDKDVFNKKVAEITNEPADTSKSSDISTRTEQMIVTLRTHKSIEEQNAITAKLVDAFPDNAIVKQTANAISPSSGNQFLLKCLTALLVASVLLVIYIAFRFRRIGGWSAGVTGIISLIHDLLFVLALFVFLRIPLNDNFMAVLLTILGYSLNDTIIIYDRIRENKKIYGKKLTIPELVNKSANQSFARALLTSVCTIIPMAVICIFCVVFNVRSILTFTFPLLIGLVAGSYSSIFIASALWALWQERVLKKADKNKK